MNSKSFYALPQLRHPSNERVRVSLRDREAFPRVISYGHCRLLVPRLWAVQSKILGERESGTARLEEAVAAYRAALNERTHERGPLDWAMSTGNQGLALMILQQTAPYCTKPLRVNPVYSSASLQMKPQSFSEARGQRKSRRQLAHVPPCYAMSSQSSRCQWRMRLLPNSRT